MRSPLGPTPDPAEVTQLVHEVRAHRYADVSPDGELLALAALLRCAHLLESMVTVDAVAAAPLLAIAFRDVVETAVNGLYCLAQPLDVARFIKKDLVARRSIANRLGKSDDMATFLGEHADWLDGAVVPPFPDRVAEVERAFPNRMPPAQAALVTAMYGYLSNFTQHGGAAVLSDYLAQHESGHGIRPVPLPPPRIHPHDAVGMAAGFTLHLFGAMKDHQEGHVTVPASETGGGATAPAPG